MKHFKILFLIFSFLSLWQLPAIGEEDLKSLFKGNDTFPDISADNFIVGIWRPFFKWLSETEKNGAHYPGYRNSPPLKFLGFKAWDANVRFEDQKLKTIDISLYNRGDSGQIEEAQFEDLLKKVDAGIAAWIGAKAEELPRQRLPKNKGYINVKIWTKGQLAVKMKWSLSQIKNVREDKPEYLNIELFRFDPKDDPRKSAGKAPQTDKGKVANIKDNIKKNDNGEIYIDNIPMVDQGPKGYCAVAVTERILRYYGQEIDQHVMAQLADTGQGGGTDPNKMMEMLKKAGVKFRVKVKEYMESMNSLELMRDMEKYNKLRKRKKLPDITPVNGFEQNYMQLKQDIPTYKEYKCTKQKTDYGKFKKAIVTSVDSGIPLVWGVQLGLIEEKEIPQAFGGHLRMIIGYNNKTNEVLYSDTWGAGHELKKMNWDDAWTITTSYSNIFPRK